LKLAGVILSQVIWLSPDGIQLLDERVTWDMSPLETGSFPTALTDLRGRRPAQSKTTTALTVGSGMLPLAIRVNLGFSDTLEVITDSGNIDSSYETQYLTSMTSRIRYFNFRTFSTFLVFAFFTAMVSSPHASEGDDNVGKNNIEILASSGSYQLYYQGTEDGQGGIVILTKDGNMVDSGEDAFYLIGKCSSEDDKTSLTTEYVKRDIADHGGSEAYQVAINGKIKTYGKDFFSFLPKFAVDEYAKQGVKFD